jgi:hypothetical protein
VLHDRTGHKRKNCPARKSAQFLPLGFCREEIKAEKEMCCQNNLLLRGLWEYGRDWGRLALTRPNPNLAE